MTDQTPAAGGLSEHRICNARHGQVACYCSALTWMTLDEYGEHIEGIAAAPAPSEAEAALRDERNHWIGESKRYERLYRRANEDAIRLFKQRNEAREATEAADRELARVKAELSSTRDALAFANESVEKMRQQIERGVGICWSGTCKQPAVALIDGFPVCGEHGDALADARVARVKAAVEAVIDRADNLWARSPGERDGYVSTADLRAALSSADTTALDRERAKAAGEALREAADDVLLDESAGDYGTHVWLKRRAAAVSPEGGDA